MIVSAEEYANNVWLLNNANLPSRALLLPRDEAIFEIDLNSRTIKAPPFLSVETDHRAEVIYFVCDRFYDVIDLANTSCSIQFKNTATKGGQISTGIYPVPFYDVSTFSGSTPYKRIALRGPDDDSTSVLPSYEDGKYYYRDSSGEYILATNGYDSRTEYYSFSANNAQYLPAYVLPSNYQPNKFYLKQDDGTFTIATGSYNSKATYYEFVDCPKILIPWELGGAVTAFAGTVEFNICFYILDEALNFTFRLNTLNAKSKILDTLILTDEEAGAELEKVEPTWIQEVNDKLNKLIQGTPEEKGYELYWTEVTQL